MSPLRYLIPGLGFVLIILPMIEIALFVVVGGQIGVLGTLAAVIATGVIGAAVLSRQGMATWERMNRNLEAGEIPIREVFEGFLMVIAAVLLITPGFATDVLGFSLTVPAVRGFLAEALKNRARVQVRTGSTTGNMHSAAEDDGVVIEGELIETESPRQTPWSPDKR
ncbi:MAG: FxsA family protein [Pseudomonadota bacterium]